MKKFLLSIFAMIVLLPIAAASAETSTFALTITPPLIKNNMEKGDSWASQVKVVNNNNEPAVVYASVVDFKNREDGAGPEFIQKDSEDAGKQAHYLLSQWMDVQSGPIEIPAQQSVEIPFSIKLPDNAEPGGHYAAILIGTKPEGRISGTAIKTTTELASLVMININGDVKEKGKISEFSVDKTLLQKPEADFVVRFKNEGNIHLQPIGDITIESPLGKEKGKMNINHDSIFGNVLPDSSREWKFHWQSDDSSWWEMGRYKAILVLTFGDQAKETIDQVIYFWVINFKLLGIIVGTLMILILIIVMMVKRYVKRAILETVPQAGLSTEKAAVEDRRVMNAAPTLPVKKASGAIDLRSGRGANVGKRMN